MSASCIGAIPGFNLQTKCSSHIRCHLLLKTFWGWRDQQLRDGTPIWGVAAHWAVGLSILMLFALPSTHSSNMRRPSRPTADDQSALPENRPESKTHKGVGVAASQNIEISKKGYAAFDAGDVETVLNDYDDNVEFVVPGNSAVSGTYRGKDGVKELFGKVA